MNKKFLIIGALVIVIGVLTFLLWPWNRLADTIAIPYIAHQQPHIDPYLPAAEPLSDKLDEVLFDGLFNVSANPSGITYENALGEMVGSISNDNVVTIRLRTDRKWHNSFNVKTDDDDITISDGTPNYFSAKDLAYSLQRIERLGSLSPDYILVSQALTTIGFSGPNENNEIQFKFKSDRIWTDADIKEVLSFKILPEGSDPVAANYTVGTGPYLALAPKEDIFTFYKNPTGNASITRVLLNPFIDNSTFPSELKSAKINTLLDTPFGSLSPILEDPEYFFYKSNVSTTFFALLFNVERVPREKRLEIRKWINRQAVLGRFFKINTQQQRSIVDYKGNKNNFKDYLNNSVFPSSSYYVEEKIVTPKETDGSVNMALLPDTLRVKACLNFGLREEYSELIDIFNDPALFNNRIRVTAVTHDEIKNGNYDAVLIAFTGYRSTFLFDLYDIFLREPDLSRYQINLVTETGADGKAVVSPRSLTAGKNFFRMDASNPNEGADFVRLLESVYGFMSTREIGDKQAYAQFVHQTEEELGLGTWLFSVPSLSYFRTQFNPQSIDLYGVASQLSTIEKWKEQKK
ncbi:hypothetical protein HUU42_05660 [bacterium]|nr:hypothetical protein [bacterium]